VVLVKSVRGTVAVLADPYFPRAKPRDVRAVVLAAGEVEGLADVLS
jgi:hypothetical protein